MAWTQGGTYHPSASESQAAAAGTAPSTTADGVSLRGVKSYVVAVAAEATRTLSGSGNLRAYMYSPEVALWGRAPELDIAVTASSIRTQYSGEFVVVGPRAALSDSTTGRRIAYVADTVGISGGTNVVVYILCHRDEKGDH